MSAETAVAELMQHASARFHSLVREWKAATRSCPSAARMAMHPAYQQIVGMGPTVLPDILRELKREEDHWFWALRAISGENPVAPENAGRLEEMTKAWIEWGKGRGLID